MKDFDYATMFLDENQLTWEILFMDCICSQPLATIYEDHTNKKFNAQQKHFKPIQSWPYQPKHTS